MHFIGVYKNGHSNEHEVTATLRLDENSGTCEIHNGYGREVRYRIEYCSWKSVLNSIRKGIWTNITVALKLNTNGITIKEILEKLESRIILIRLKKYVGEVGYSSLFPSSLTDAELHSVYDECYLVLSQRAVCIYLGDREFPRYSIPLNEGPLSLWELHEALTNIVRKLELL